MLSPETAEQGMRIYLGDLLIELGNYADARNIARKTGSPLGPATGLAQMDEALGGALQTGLHVVTGNTGAGKTAFALQTAVECGFPALYVSCEMAPLELLLRIMARVTRTPLGMLKSGELAKTPFLDLARTAIKQCPDVAILDTRGEYTGAEWIATHGNIVKREAAQVLVVVDSLHSWVESFPGSDTEYERLNRGIMELQGVAAWLNSPVLYIAERNRQTRDTGGAGSGAGSRKIEYGAETQIDLQRDLTIQPDLHHEVDVTAKFAKNRNGFAGKTVSLKFNGVLQSYREIGE